MSEHPREAQRHLKKINLCDDVCFDTLDFFGPATLGLKIALISSRFDALVDQILRRKRWQIDVIQIRRMGDGTGPLEIAKDYGDIRKKSLTYPIADSPLLNGITGFKYLDISYVNDDVITFLRRFQRLFNQTGIRLCFMIFEGNQGWDMVMRDLWPLVAKNVIQLFLFGTTADLLNRYLTASVLLHDCVNVEAIRTPYVFPEALPLEEEAKNLGQALFKWLHVPMHNGRPKKLISNCSLLSPEAFEKSMEGFKKCFVNATTPVSYIIAIEREFYGGLFELENGRTQERLTINGRYRQYLKRFPIEWDASRLHNLEGEVLCSYFTSGDNLIDVSPFQGEKELREKYWTA